MRNLIIALSISLIVLVPFLSGAYHVANEIKANLSMTADRIEKLTKM